MESKISFEQVLAEYKNDNGMSAHTMLKELTETASWEEKCNFAEYVLFVEAKYKDSFLEDYALEYIVNGTDAGYQAAIELLIKYVLKEKLANQILEKAYTECLKLLESTEDDKEREKYNKWKELLEQQRMPVSVEQSVVQEVTTAPQEVAPAPQEVAPVLPIKKLPSVLLMISSVLWIVVYTYFLIDIHSDVWSTSLALHWIPRIPEVGLLGIPFLEDYIGINGLFALILAVVASTLSAIGKWSEKIKAAKRIQVLSDVLCALLVLLHAYLQYLNGFSIYENIVEYAIMLVGAMLIGSILGSIGRKILKMEEKNNVQ